MSTTFNLSIIAGETRVVVVTLTDQDGLAIDLTDAVIHYHAALPTPMVKTNAVNGGITITDALGGEFEIALEQTDTIGVTRATTVQHECKVLLASGDVVVAFTGKLAVGVSLIGELPPE